MQTKGFLTVALAILGAVSFRVSEDHVSAQSGNALSGVVSSQEEGKMEGVLVSARGDGANFTVTVVSDAQGRYSFPRTHLAPGKYALSIRAAGYDLADPGPVDVTAGKTAAANLSLQKTKDLASQLTNVEWLDSMPGTAEQKDKLVDQAASCAYCHTYRRILKSKHTAEEFVGVITRMQSYFPDGTAVSDDGRGQGTKNEDPAAGGKNPNWGTASKVELGQYLASVNLSAGRTTWPYELKTRPRPKGKATRVIVTQYDLPRKNTVSHDMTMDSKGILWYTDESHPFLGKLDPKTATITEIPMPPVPAGALAGTRDIDVDKDDNLWFPLRVGRPGHALPTKLDTKTMKLSYVELPDKPEREGLPLRPVQFVAVGPDGKVWMKGQNVGPVYRIDPVTMKVDRRFHYLQSEGVPPGNMTYMEQIDSKGTPWFTGNSTWSSIVRVDPDTGVVKYYATPTPNAYPRRGAMDQQDRFWFGEYFADQVAMFDTHTLKFQEWRLPKNTQPYFVTTPDRNGRVYASSNMSETLSRLDPKTGEVVEYLMPTNFDAKKIVHDPTTNRPTLWMSNTRNARLVKVEPLD